MKKILLVFAALLPLIAYAQNHIKFMGHFIDEPEYINTLIKDGKIAKDPDLGYTCSFGGYESCVSFIPNPNNLNEIIVIKITKPKYERWVDLKHTYYSYKELFLKKYTLLKEIEETGIRYNSNLSENEFALHNIQQGDGKFSSVFLIPNGKILMFISPKEGKEYPDYGEVVIYYQDDLNWEKSQKQSENEQLDDI